MVENAVARRHLRLAMFLVATNGARPMWPAGELSEVVAGTIKAESTANPQPHVLSRAWLP